VSGKAIEVYDAASNCLTLSYEQNENYYILALQRDWLVVFLARDSIYAIVRYRLSSVHLSITQVDQSKTVEATTE